MEGEPSSEQKRFQSFLEASISDDVIFADYFASLDRTLTIDPAYLGIIVPPRPFSQGVIPNSGPLSYQILRNADVNEIDAESLEAALQRIDVTNNHRVQLDRQFINISPQYFVEREYWSLTAQRVIDQFVKISGRCVGSKVPGLRQTMRSNLLDNFEFEPDDRQEALKRILANLNAIDTALALRGGAKLESLPAEIRQQLELRHRENAKHVKLLWE